eukprot:gb/GECH01012260.1/.p1 GENE.gb/GECH01012260.1/~~gb/GECH01012260.1/.p1  ORF type:complete len:292 (+),score=58.00 gb/GECH01012260.1/:1-876(+)
MPANVKTFFEPTTSTCVYVVTCPETQKAAIIDPVLDIDVHRGEISTQHADTVIEYVKNNTSGVEWILETHAHADHSTSAQYMKQHFPDAKTAIGANICLVQRVFSEVYNLGDSLTTDGSQWDRLFHDGDKFQVGKLQASVLHTPGHTPACISYYFEDDAVFVGDTIFMPDMGTARCDFPHGSAETLWNSTQRILSLPKNVRIFVGHDYAPGGREHAWESSVEDELKNNKHVKEGTKMEDFVKVRTERDVTLNTPRLLPAVMPINIRGGHLPPKESNGTRYLKIPLKGKTDI